MAIGPGVLNLLHASCRWKVFGSTDAVSLISSGRPGFFAIWHYNVLSALYYFRATRSIVMVSRSRDGDLAATLARRWGYTPIRGSRMKGGQDAAVEMIRLVRRGHNGGLVADGSQGPARKAQTGAAFISRATGVPLVPVVISARHRLVLPTWDRTQIPLPFSGVAVWMGDPFQVPPRAKGIPLETSRRQLEETLNDLCRRAEAHWPTYWPRLDLSISVRKRM